jgi:hypothetical protein
MKRYDLMQDINVRGTFLLSKLALPALRESDAGQILTLSPPLNLDPKWAGMHLAYTMAKYGMSLTTLGLAAGFLDLLGGGVDRAFELGMRLAGLGQQDDVGAVARGADGDGQADAAASPGDEDGAALEGTGGLVGPCSGARSIIARSHEDTLAESCY